MNLEALITMARDQGASDLHLEAGLPPALRVRGALKTLGEPLSAEALAAMAHAVAGADGWASLQEQRSLDLARTLVGVRCRINILHSSRGVGMAVRLLSSFQATLKRLNLHPDLKKLVAVPHGLVLVTGPTGSGKTSTLAALVQEINAAEARHVITLESPIEYALRPLQCFIRQREVGRDTPSFAQGLKDALREDPDVLLVGEMRDPETMRLTLDAAETGHLVLATLHASSPAEALQRLVSAFPAEVQPATCAALADCLVGVLAQRLRYQARERLRVPECELLLGTTAARAVIRAGQFFKLPSVMESGGQEGQWPLARYRDWLDHKTDWFIPSGTAAEPPEEGVVETPRAAPAPVAAVPRAAPSRPVTPPATPVRRPAAPAAPAAAGEERVIVLNEDDTDLASIVSDLQRK